MVDRFCYACGDNKTYFDKRGNCYLWYKNHDLENNVICSYCYKNIWWHKKWGKRRLVYKGKRIYLDKEPRIGICENCGKKGYTHIHHDKYNDKNPLEHTRELCPSCHAKETHRLKQYKIPLELRPRDYHGRYI